MFSFCSDPEQLGNARWMACYLTTGVHLQFYAAFFKVLLLLAITAPVAIANFTGDSQFEEPTGSIAAAAVVITIPIIIFVLFFQRRIVAGLTSGAVKG